MSIRTRAFGPLAGILVSIVVATGVAQAADRPYTEGTVSVVQSIRTEPGMFQAYMKYLSTTYKQIMEEEKKAGIIVDYAVYQSTPHTATDPDVYLVVTYKNMAALDGLNDRTDPILDKIAGPQEQRDTAMAARGKMRTSLGTETIRQLVLK
jgi:hypothetical protein